MGESFGMWGQRHWELRDRLLNHILKPSLQIGKKIWCAFKKGTNMKSQKLKSAHPLGISFFAIFFEVLKILFMNKLQKGPKI